MNGTDIKRSYRDQLARRILDEPIDPSNIRPLGISPQLAVSLLQKSIRRGEYNLAQRAAATLLQIAPDRLWRRCVVIAAEEIGVANIDAVGLVTAAATAGKSWRSKVGGEITVGQFVTSIMARSDKCRATDDLAVVAAYHPSLVEDRRALASAPTRELLEVAISKAPLPRRALALWYALGTDRHRAGDVQRRRGEPAAAFDFLCEAGLPHSGVEIAREGYRTSGESICAFVPLLLAERNETPVLKSDDAFPASDACGPRSWARDGFTPEGRRSLVAFLQTACPSARWIRAHIPPSQQAAFLGGVLFRVESGLVRNRVQWPLAIELRRIADIECHGPHCPDATEILALLRADIPLLNEVRAHVR